MKMKHINSKRFVALFIVFTILIVSSVILLWNKNTQQLEKVLLHASWTNRYEDVEDLSVNSDCIAIIKVGDNGTTNSNNTIPETLFSVEVIRPIYNCEKGEKLTVYMTGGIKDNRLFEIGDDPLMKKGEQYLIFAKMNEDGTFTALSGTQGRMQYRKGKINSLNVVNNQVMKKTSSTIEINNALADELVSEITKYTSKK